MGRSVRGKVGIQSLDAQKGQTLRSRVELQGKGSMATLGNPAWEG